MTNNKLYLLLHTFKKKPIINQSCIIYIGFIVPIIGIMYCIFLIQAYRFPEITKSMVLLVGTGSITILFISSYLMYKISVIIQKMLGDSFVSRGLAGMLFFWLVLFTLVIQALTPIIFIFSLMPEGFTTTSWFEILLNTDMLLWLIIIGVFGFIVGGCFFKTRSYRKALN